MIHPACHLWSGTPLAPRRTVSQRYLSTRGPMASTASRPAERLRLGHIEQLDDEHLRTLLRLSHEFNSTLDLSTLLPRILDLVLETLNAEAGSLWVIEGQVVRCLASAGEIGEILVGLELPLGAGIVGHVALTGEPALVDEATEDEHFLPQLDEATSFATGSVMAVPLIAKGEVIGALEVANHRGDGERFDSAQLDFLRALADDAAAAVRNARLFEAERRARDLKALLSFSHEVAATLELDRIYVSVVNLAGEAIQFDRCVLAAWEGDELHVRAIAGQEEVDRRARAVRELERFLLWAAEREEPLSLDDTQSEGQVAEQLRTRFPEYLEESGARALLALPLEDGEGRIGILLFEGSSAGAFSGWRREAAELIGSAATLSLRNAQLYAGVPFISWLEPLAKKSKALAGLPRSTWLRYGVAAALVLAVLTLGHVPLRIPATTAEVRAAAQRPAHAGVGGVLEAVLVREGDRVVEGQPIARLRDEERLSRIRELEAEVAVARREALGADARGDASAGALARVRAAGAEEALRLLRAQDDRALVRAPASGLVLTPRLEERTGMYVDAGAPVAWIGDPDWAEVELAVPQQDVGRIEQGNRVRVRSPANPGVTFEGRVAAVAPRAAEVDGVPSYRVRVVLDNRAGLLRPGMEVKAKVLAESVPLGTVVFRRPWRWLRMNSWWMLPI